jgi:hypothetical protein
VLKNVTQGQSTRAIRLVIVPPEHGGWAFLLEPLALGLLVAPSISGVWLALAAAAVFMVRQPLKQALADRRGGKRYPRTALAERFAAGFALLALVALVPAVFAARAPFWPPILLAAPVALLQAYFDMRRRSRQVAAELAGALAIGAAGAAITLAGGFALPAALALWALLGLRAVASILYVRARLRLERGEPPHALQARAVQVGALAAGCLLVYAGLLPWPAALLLALLAARAFWGLSPFRRPARAAIIGVQELGISLLTVVSMALAYHAAGF